MKSTISFKALRAFEASVRLGSLSNAARVLNVTPGAVSRQITALEHDLGTQIMTRDRHGVSVTQRGRALAEELAVSFAQIDTALAHARAVDHGRAVVLQAWPTFAIQWLMPRLANFHSACPGIDLRIQTSLSEPDFSTGEVDLAVVITEELSENLDGLLLFGRDYSPVCGPDLLKRSSTNSLREAFETGWVLVTEMHAGHWADWCNLADITPDFEAHAIQFENSSLAWQGARDGAGFAMGQLALLAPDLDKGTLVAPFEETLSDSRCYWLAYKKSSKDWRELRSVIDWFANQLAESEATE